MRDGQHCKDSLSRSRDIHEVWVSLLRLRLTLFSNNMTTVAYLFERKGVVRVTPTTEGGATFDTLFDTALDGGAEDVREVEEEEGTQWEVSA